MFFATTNLGLLFRGKRKLICLGHALIPDIGQRILLWRIALYVKLRFEVSG